MQILGPVRQDKVIELLEKGSLREEDEVSAANGFWFCLNEKELVDRYLYNNEKQPFNPISEAPCVLTSPETLPTKSEERREERVSPSQDDLEYPTIEIAPAGPDCTLEIEVDEDDERDDVTMMINEETLTKEIPQVEIESQPEMAPIEIRPPVEELLRQHDQSGNDEDDNTSPAAIKISRPKGKKHRPTPTIKKNDRYLFVLLILMAVLVAGIVYYYRTVLNKPLPGFELSLLLPTAHAQSILSSGSAKKKILKNIYL